MKILLIQPPHYYNGGTRLPEFFPLGLGYIAQVLLGAGHEVEVLDIWAHQYSDGEVIQKVKGFDYDIAGISALSTQYKYVKWLTGLLKQHSKNKIVVGGALATYSPEIVLKYTDADICVVGEGEITARELVEHIDDLGKVQGIYFKDGGEIIQNLPRKYIEDLDSLEFPPWELFPLDSYFKYCHVAGHLELKTMDVITSRGCPYNCRFCSKTFTGVRFRSIGNVVEEIKLLCERYGIRGIFFNDEELLLNKGRIYELCDKIQPLNINWDCQGRVNLVDFALLKRMKEAGCVVVGYGVESGSQKILDNMNKHATVAQAEQAIKDTLRAGMYPWVQMMYGYPGETRQTLRETADFFKRVPYLGRLHYMQRIRLTATVPLPGSELYQDALQQGLIEDEGKYLEGLAGGYLPDGTRQLVNFTDFSEEEFYRLKWETEKQIYLNQIREQPWSFFLHWASLFVSSLLIAMQYLKRNGLRQTVREARRIIRLKGLLDSFK